MNFDAALFVRNHLTYPAMRVNRIVTSVKVFEGPKELLFILFE
jgi:hypothetical protein